MAERRGAVHKEITRTLLDQPAAIEALQWVGDLHSRHKVAGLTPDLNAMGAQNIAQAIQQGGVAMWWMGRWGLPDLRKLSAVKYEAYPLPRGKKEANVFLQSGPTAGAGTKHPEVVWEFLKTWTGPEGQTINIEFRRLHPHGQGQGHAGEVPRQGAPLPPEQPGLPGRHEGGQGAAGDA